MKLIEFVAYFLLLWLIICLIAGTAIPITTGVFFAAGVLAFLIDLILALLCL